MPSSWLEDASVKVTSRLWLLTRRKTVSAETLKRGWASVVIQRRWRGYRVRQVYQAVRWASVTIQAFTRGWMARKRYKKVAVRKTRLVFSVKGGCNRV